MAAAREERLRAEGVSEEQIEMIRSQIAGASAAHRANSWEVELTRDQRATVQIVPADSEEGAELARLESRWGRENGTDGARPQDIPALAALVRRYTRGADECYELSGQLAARSATHVALVRSPRIGTDILAALAAVALRSRIDPA